MQDNGLHDAIRLGVLAEAIGMVKEAYLKTKDRRLAAAALVLTELALNEIDAIDKKAGNEEAQYE